jgi:pimeloyl-ACP methyl ester carboxylesterase
VREESLPTLFRTRSGRALAADAAGPVAGPAVLLLHGGGQTRHSWGTALASLADVGFCAISLDMRGHGDSDWSPEGDYRIERLVEDVVDVARALDRSVALVGASLGGLTALHVAAHDVVPLSALVLVDVVPRVEADGAAQILSFMRSGADGFASIEEAAAKVAAYLPHRRRPPSSEGLRKNLRRKGDRFFWHWDPAFLDMPKAQDLNLAKHLAAASMIGDTPVLLVHGGLSRVVGAEGVREFRDVIPHAKYVRLPDADHMVAGDANDAFNKPLIKFLTAHISLAVGV